MSTHTHKNITVGDLGIPVPVLGVAPQGEGVPIPDLQNVVPDTLRPGPVPVLHLRMKGSPRGVPALLLGLVPIPDLGLLCKEMAVGVLARPQGTVPLVAMKSPIPPNRNAPQLPELIGRCRGYRKCLNLPSILCKHAHTYIITAYKA